MRCCLAGINVDALITLLAEIKYVGTSVTMDTLSINIQTLSAATISFDSLVFIPITAPLPSSSFMALSAALRTYFAALLGITVEADLEVNIWIQEEINVNG